MAHEFERGYLGDIALLVRWGVPFGIACRRASEVHRVDFDTVTHLALGCALDRAPRHPKAREVNAALATGLESVAGVTLTEMAQARWAAGYGLRRVR